MALTQPIYFFCFYYPPMARSRSRQIFAHVLAERGFPIRVISVRNPHGFFNKFMMDHSISKDPPEVIVDRVRAPNWWALGEVLAHVGLLPDAQMNWVWAVRRRWKKITEKPKGILFGLYPPFADIVLALWAKETTGWPLVLDYRDEFLDAASLKPNRRQKKLFEVERSALLAADLISVTSATVQQRLHERYNIPNERFVLTYNGYDAVAAVSSVSVKAGVRKIESGTKVVYAGAISQHQKPEVLCEAYHRLLSKHPELRGKISVTFYGPENYYFRHFFRRHLGEGLRYGGFLPYREVQGVVSSFDVGFFSLASETYDYAMPRKLFDYISAELPILAALPKGEAQQFVEKHGVGKVSHYSDIDGLADHLYDYAVKSGEITRIKANIRKVKTHFSLQKQVEKLSQRIMEMVG